MLDRQYLVLSLVYAVLGLLMGIYMATAKNHSLLVVHVHMMLLGFVVLLFTLLFIKTGCRALREQLRLRNFVSTRFPL